MITTEGPYGIARLYELGDGFSDVITKNGNGGTIVRKNQFTNFISTETGIPTYNVGFGSTLPTAAWVRWTAAQCDGAGISTEGMDPNNPDEKKVVQINIEASNIWTTSLYGDCPRIEGMKLGGSELRTKWFDLYEKADDRKARHKELRNAGLQPPYPRADKFLKNKHLTETQVGLTTDGSY